MPQLLRESVRCHQHAASGAGRGPAGAEALSAAAQLRVANISTLLVDTSPQPQAGARALAQTMGAHYLALPYAAAQVLQQAVRAVAGRA